MTPEPTPVAVPPNGPRGSPAWLEVIVTTVSRAVAIMSVRSLSVTLTGATVEVPVGEDVAVAGGSTRPPSVAEMTAQVEPEASAAARTAAPMTVLTVRRTGGLRTGSTGNVALVSARAGGGVANGPGSGVRGGHADAEGVRAMDSGWYWSDIWRSGVGVGTRGGVGPVKPSTLRRR